MNIALVAQDNDRKQRLLDILQQYGLQVLEQLPDMEIHPMADVVLADLPGMDQSGFDALIQLSMIPVLFNEGVIQQDACWQEGLLSSLKALLNDGSAVPLIANDSPMHLVSRNNEGLANSTSPHKVVVMLASLGGPQAIKRFLQHLPEYIPAAFILVQKVGETLQSLMVEQMTHFSSLNIQMASGGQRLMSNSLVMLPSNRSLSIDPSGVMNFSTRLDVPSLDLNQAMSEVAIRYGEDACVIVFSGMEHDIEEGCQQIHQAGGRVWAQDAVSCAMSRLPDAIRKSGLVDFSGSPEALAEQLVNSL